MGAFGFKWKNAWKRRFPATKGPVNTVLPSKPTGTLTSGQVLTSPDTGTWTGDPTIIYARQWFNADPVLDGGSIVLGGDGDIVYINPQIIGGATGSTYTLTDGDAGKVMGVTVTASNPAGSASASSFVTDPIVTAGGAMDFSKQANSGLLALLEDF